MSLWITRALAGDTFSQNLRSPDIRRRLLFTLGVLVAARCLEWVPMPGLGAATIANLFEQRTWWAGHGAVERLSIASLGLGPYVSMWALMEIFRGGMSEATVERFRLFGSVVFAIFQAYGIAVGLEQVRDLVPEPGSAFRATTVATLVATSLLMVWLGGQITRRGLGPGIWVLMAAGIVTELPAALAGLYELARTGAIAASVIGVLKAIAVGVVALVVAVELAERRVPLLSRLPGAAAPPPLTFTIDHATVAPAYLASSLLLMPVTLAQFFGANAGPDDWLVRLVTNLGRGQALYLALYAVLIVALTFLITAVRVRPDDMATGLVHAQADIAGVPPARAERYLDRIATWATVLCALYLTALGLLPELLITHFAVPVYLGGTSVLIVVLVALHILRGMAMRATAGAAADRDTPRAAVTPT